MVKLVLIVFLSFLLVVCERSDDLTDHSHFDRNVGQASLSQFTFSGHDGLLHVTSVTEENIELLASAPEFSFTIRKNTSQPVDLTITIGNVPSDIEIIGLGSGEEVAGNERIWLAKQWTVTLNEEVQTFSTVKASSENFSYLVFGDIQRGLDDFDEMITIMNEQNDAAFIIGVGDLTNNTQDDEFTKLISHYQKLRLPVYVTPGNHDVFRGELFQKHFGSATYSFDYRGVRFTSIDSAFAGLSGYTWERYERWAEQQSGRLHVVYSHYPSTDVSGIRAGHWSKRREAFRFQAISSKFDVDLLMFGHIHSFDQYRIAGIDTVITGGSGGIPEELDGIGRHFIRIDVDIPNAQFKIQAIEVP